MNDYYAAAQATGRLDELHAEAARQRLVAGARRARRRTAAPPAVSSDPAVPHHRRHVVRHFVEMVVAMVVGMALLGGLTYGALSLAGLDESEISAELEVLVMVFNMAVGMTVWMRHRGHGWSHALEMDAAMFVPFLALFPLLWTQTISEDAMFGLGHLLMIPAMGATTFRQRRHHAQT